MKKYEIYLPLKYNDGQEIEPEKLKEIRQQLIAVFGAITVSSLTAPFQGTWRYGGVEFVDDVIRVRLLPSRIFAQTLSSSALKSTSNELFGSSKF